MTHRKNSISILISLICFLFLFITAPMPSKAEQPTEGAASAPGGWAYELTTNPVQTFLQHCAFNFFHSAQQVYGIPQGYDVNRPNIDHTNPEDIKHEPFKEIEYKGYQFPNLLKGQSDRMDIDRDFIKARLFNPITNAVDSISEAFAAGVKEIELKKRAAFEEWGSNSLKAQLIQTNDSIPFLKGLFLNTITLKPDVLNGAGYGKVRSLINHANLEKNGFAVKLISDFLIKGFVRVKAFLAV